MITTKLKEGIKYLFEGITIRDVLLLLILPTVTLIIMFLPMNIQNSMKLNLSNPMPWQYFTSAFVHYDWNHFKNNITLYLIETTLFAMILGKNPKLKRVFFRLMFIILITVPIFSSLCQVFLYPKFIPLYKNANFQSEGTSGIVAALTGLIPAFIFSKRTRETLTSIALGVLYIGFSFVILERNISYSTQIIKSISILIPILLYVVKLTKIKNKSLKEAVPLFIESLLLLIFLILPIMLFPTNPVKGTQYADIETHFFCFIYGMALGVTVTIKRSPKLNSV